MRSLKLTVAYDGTAYAGWQIQPDAPTIQGALERALRQIVGRPVRTVASGRTDAGVHALGQVVGFSTDCDLAPEVLQRALNAHLPRDIAVREAVEAREGFHPIRDARGKRYRYVIHNDPVRDVFSQQYAWHVPGPLDAGAMHRGARHLLGTHDFASFQTSGSERASTVRTITEIRVEAFQPDCGRRIVIEVAADGFLYNMVRAIVGTLVEVGRGAQKESWPAEVVAACDRTAAGATAPACGLFLVSVKYDQ